MQVSVYVYKNHLRIKYLESVYPCGLLPKLFFQLSVYVKADEERNHL